MTQAPALHMQGVSRHYGRRRILHDIDLSVPAGQRVVIEGANGAGKTTLLRMAAGTLHPTAGTVHVGGRAPRSLRRGDLFYVPQAAPVYDELTPVQQIRWWGRLHGLATAGHDAVRIAADAGLADNAHRPAAVLSRGQRQRLALACALHVRPRLLLLDEPASALDTEGTAWLAARLGDQDGAVVAVVHGPNIVPHARRVVVTGGSIQEAAP